MFDVGNQIITKKTMGHHILDLSAETKMDFAAPSPWQPNGFNWCYPTTLKPHQKKVELCWALKPKDNWHL